MSSAKKQKLLQQINSESGEEESPNSQDRYEQNTQLNGIERKKGETLFQFLQRRTKYQLSQNIKQKKKDFKPELGAQAFNLALSSTQTSQGQGWKSYVQSPANQLQVQADPPQIFNQTLDVICKTPNISSFKTPLNPKTTIFESMSKSAGKRAFLSAKKDIANLDKGKKSDAQEHGEKKKVKFTSDAERVNSAVPGVLLKKFDLVTNMIVGYEHFMQNLLSRIHETLNDCSQLGKCVENYPDFFDAHLYIKEKINELKVSSAFLNQSSKQSITLSEILNTLNEFQSLYESEREQYISEVNTRASQKAREEKEAMQSKIKHLEEELQHLKYSQKLQQSGQKQDLLDKFLAIEKEHLKLKGQLKEQETEKKQIISDNKKEMDRLTHQIRQLQQKTAAEGCTGLIKEIQERYEEKIISMEHVIKELEAQIKRKHEAASVLKRQAENDCVLEEQINKLNQTMNMKENLRQQQKSEWEELYRKSKEENRFLKGENNALKLENEKLLKKISEFNSEKRQLDAYIKQNDLLLQRLQDKHDECDNLLNILKQIKEKSKEAQFEKHLKGIFKKLTPAKYSSKTKPN